MNDVEEDLKKISAFRKESNALVLHVSQADYHPDVTLFGKMGEGP